MHFLRSILALIASLSLHQTALQARPAEEFWAFSTPQELPFAEEWVVQKEENGVICKEFYFTSEIVGGESYRVYAIYSAPKTTGKVPAILYIHGATGTADPAMVAEWVKRGYACLSFDWTADPKDKQFKRIHFSKFGDLTDMAYSATGFLSPPSRSRMHQTIIAARRALSWMQLQPEVASDNLGVLGISWGGFAALLLNGIDDRIKAMVDIYGAGFFQESGVNGGCFGVTGPLQSLPREQQVEWLKHFDPAHYVLHSRAPTLIFSGTNDIFFWLPLVMKTFAALPVEKRLVLEPNINHTLSKGAIIDAAARWFGVFLRASGNTWPTVEIADAGGRNLEVRFTRGASPIEAVQVAWFPLRERADHVPISTYTNKEKVWQTGPSTLAGDGQTATFSLPEFPKDIQSVAVFATAETNDGVRVSSPLNLVEISQAGAASGPEAIDNRGMIKVSSPTATVISHNEQAPEEGNLFQDSSFESGPFKKGRVGALFLNFQGDEPPLWDDSGAHAHTGNAAVGFLGKQAFGIGAPAEAGKRYRFSLWMRSQAIGRKGRVQINWNRADSDPAGKLIHFELKQPALKDEYQLVEIIAEAPPGTIGANLIVGGNGSDDESDSVWIDDIYFGEAP